MLIDVLVPNKVSNPAKSSSSSKSDQAAISETVGMFAHSAIVGSIMLVKHADSNDAEDMSVTTQNSFKPEHDCSRVSRAYLNTLVKIATARTSPNVTHCTTNFVPTHQLFVAHQTHRPLHSTTVVTLAPCRCSLPPNSKPMNSSLVFGGYRDVQPMNVNQWMVRQMSYQIFSRMLSYHRPVIPL